MCRINLMTLSLLLVLGPAGLMSEHTQNADGTIKDLYEYLLQREYAAPVSYADHQIKRKAVRSPSLRLRFGRRSDPSMPVRSEKDDTMDSSAIHPPQKRLRFGRQEPMFPTGEDYDENDPMSYDRPPSKRFRWGRSGGMKDDTMDSSAIHPPQKRLRFGRQEPMFPTGEDYDENDPMSYDRPPSKRFRWGRSGGMEDDMMVSRPIRAPQLRLRFGRQDPMFPTGEDVDENDLMSYYRPPSKRFRFGRSGGMEDDMMDSRPIRAPQLRLRFGRQDPMLPTGEDVDENDLMSYDRREPSKRFRWGRSRGMFPANDIMQQKSIRAPQLRLRFGRSDPTWAVFNEHQLDGDQIAKAAPGSSPASRNEHADDPAELTDETDTTSMNEK
ncbi:short neuropeptide F isoform X4 [Malaya genurostris]|uniref:short neuropeptide F isoform X4 n=1 Tax=Malaya genurostris TaxID=325434 RepID=UPI0026F3F25F|nr:short neuropeptide F isoform X4 [Malaya genurostris]